METEAAEGQDVTSHAVEPPPAAVVLGAGAGVAVLVIWAWAMLVVWRRLKEGRPLVAARPHGPVPWSAPDVAFVFATHLAGMAVAGRLLPVKPPLADQLFAGVMVSLLATLASVGWLSLHGATVVSLGLVGRRWREDVGLACGGLAVVLAPLLMLAGLLNRIVPYRHPIIEYLHGDRDVHAIGLVVISAVVAAPLAEEFFFRRVLQGWLERVLPAGDPTPVVVSALVFAIMHITHGLAVVPLTLLGIVLGVIAQRTGSIVPCILLHALFNAVSVLLLLAELAFRPSAG